LKENQNTILIIIIRGFFIKGFYTKSELILNINEFNLYYEKEKGSEKDVKIKEYNSEKINNFQVNFNLFYLERNSSSNFNK
jgi:hypothetical protein